MIEIAFLEVTQDQLCGIRAKVDNYRILPAKKAKMFKIVVHTQFMENYGAHEWDGNGPCPQDWRFKTGDEYIVAENISESEMAMRSPWDYLNDEVQSQIEFRSEYSRNEITSVGSVLMEFRIGIENYLTDEQLKSPYYANMLEEMRKFL